MDFLKRLKADESRVRAEAWSEYRNLLQAALAHNGVIESDADLQRMSVLVRSLGLTSEIVNNHCEALRRCKRANEDLQRLETLAGELSAIEPKVEAWKKHRQEVLDELDQEGTPMLQKASDLSASIQAIQLRAPEQEQGVQERDFPELFGRNMAVQVPAPSSDDLTRNAIEVDQRQRLESLTAGIREGRWNPDWLNDNANTSLKDLVKIGLEHGWICEADLIGPVQPTEQEKATE